MSEHCLTVKFNVCPFHRENEPGWDIEIQDDVIEECNKHGGVIHIYVDKKSTEVYDLIIITMFRKNIVKPEMAGGVSVV